MEITKSIVKGKEIEHGDVIHHRSNFRGIRFIDRIKILFGYTMTFKVEIYTANPVVFIVTDESRLLTPPFFRPKKKSGGGLQIDKVWIDELNTNPDEKGN